MQSVGVVDAKTKKRVLATLTAVLEQVHDSFASETDSDDDDGDQEEDEDDSADQVDVKDCSRHALIAITQRRHAVALQLTAPLKAIVQQALACLSDVSL
jgi:hypothetical protein